MRVGVLVLTLHLPGCGSLKEKRHRLKPLIHRLRKEFNVSVAEVDAQDVWQTAVIACTTVSNSGSHAQQVLQGVLGWVERSWAEGLVVREEMTWC